MVKARSYGQNQKLVRASFAKLQFWTERKRVYCMHLKSSNESTLLDLRVLKGGLQVGKSLGLLEQRKLWLQYKSPNWTRMQKRLIHSNFFKEHHWVFAWRWIVCIHCHLQTLGRIFEEIFKWVAVQKCLLDQIGKIGVELKVSNGQKVSLHKSDVETSHGIPKFWWNF